MDREAIECNLSGDLYSSSWIGGFHRRIRVRLLALKYIVEYLENIDTSDAHNNEMYQLFKRTNDVYTKSSSDQVLTAVEKSDFHFFQKNLILDDGIKHLPVPVHSFIKPTIPSQFI